MRKFVCAALAGAFVFTAVIPNKAFAVVPVPVPMPGPGPVPIPGGGGGGAGAGGAIGFIGFVGLLVAYDLIRRTSCSGDFLALGGPGFTQPITPDQNILAPPKCFPVRKHSRVISAKG